MAQELQSRDCPSMLGLCLRAHRGRRTEQSMTKCAKLWPSSKVRKFRLQILIGTNLYEHKHIN